MMRSEDDGALPEGHADWTEGCRLPWYVVAPAKPRPRSSVVADEEMQDAEAQGQPLPKRLRTQDSPAKTASGGGDGDRF